MQEAKERRGGMCCRGAECNAYFSESHKVALILFFVSFLFSPASHYGARSSRAIEAVLSGPPRLCHRGRCAGVPAFSLLLCDQVLSHGRYECGLAYHADTLVFGLPPPLAVRLNRTELSASRRECGSASRATGSRLSLGIVQHRSSDLFMHWVRLEKYSHIISSLGNSCLVRS